MGEPSWRTEGTGDPPGPRPRALFAAEAAAAGVEAVLVLSLDGTLPEGVASPGWEGYARTGLPVPELWLNLAAVPPCLPDRATLAAGIRREAEQRCLDAAMAEHAGLPFLEEALRADLVASSGELLPAWDASAGSDALWATAAHEMGHLLLSRLQASGALPADDAGLLAWLAGGSVPAWGDRVRDWDSCPCCVHAIAELRRCPAEWFADAWALLRTGQEAELSRFGTGLVRRLRALPGTAVSARDATMGETEGERA